MSARPNYYYLQFQMSATLEAVFWCFEGTWEWLSEWNLKKAHDALKCAAIIIMNVYNRELLQ